MSKIYNDNDALGKALNASEAGVVYRAFQRTTASISNVNSQYSYVELNLPFEEGLIRRVTIYKMDELNAAQFADIVISETSNIDPATKVCEYNSINFSNGYLDSQEEIYYSSTENKLFVFAKVNGDFSTQLFIKLDLEKVN